MSDDTTTTDQVMRPALGAQPEATKSRASKTISIVGWTALTLACLIFFSIMKLPESKLKALIQGTLSSTLSAQGIQFTSAESDLSISPLGIRYFMKGVSLKKPPEERGLVLETVKVSPSILSMIAGKLGASFAVSQGDGSLTGSFSGKNSDVFLSFNASGLNLGKMGVLPFLAGIQGTLNLEGSGSVSGDFADPKSLNGSIKLNLSKIVFDAQSIQGFAIPKLSISEGTLEFEINQGKVSLTTVKIGKPGSADDLIASASGDIQLARVMDSSVLNIKTKFSLSQNITKAFVLIDAILGPAKQAGGGYAYTINGALGAPNAIPGIAP